MKRILLLFVFCAALFSQVLLKSVADVTGDGSAHAVGNGSARWIQFIADPGNGAAIRIGDSNVSASRGARVAAGGGLMLPPISITSKTYDLSQVFYFAATNDKISIVWGQ